MMYTLYTIYKQRWLKARSLWLVVCTSVRVTHACNFQ